MVSLVSGFSMFWPVTTLIQFHFNVRFHRFALNVIGAGWGTSTSRPCRRGDAGTYRPSPAVSATLLRADASSMVSVSRQSFLPVTDNLPISRDLWTTIQRL